MKLNQPDKALAALRSLNDPAAIPVLEAVFAVNADSAKGYELNRLLIDTVGRMPHPDGAGRATGAGALQELRPR